MEPGELRINSCIKRCSRCNSSKVSNNNSRVSNKVLSKLCQICHSLLRKQWDRQCWPQQIQHEPIQPWWVRNVLGKLPPLRNTEREFVSWARRTENFVVSVHPGVRDVLTWAVEKESATVAEVVMPPDTLRMLADQLYTVLMTLVEGESFDILVGSGSGEGLEAWRRLHKRWDPLTTGRARGMLRLILLPGRAKLVELQGAVERLEDLMRRYTQRRDARNGQRHTLAEDIRMAALEALLPEELERHCQLQRSRLDTYQKLREKVVLYAEARGYVAPKLGQVSTAREDRDDPMDVGGFGQWKGRNFPKGKGKNSTGTGKGKGTGKDGKDGAKSSGRVNTPKTQSQCWNCGKTGHQYKDCWVNLGRWPQQQIQGHSNSPGKGGDAKGKPGKGGGKKGKSKDAGALVWNQQPSPVASSVASSTPQTETSTTVGTVVAIECTVLDLCATALTQLEIVNPRWSLQC